MKDLQNAFVDPLKESNLNLNKEHLLKYLIMFIVVTTATLVIPTCGVLKSQAVMVGLLASTTFAIIDMVYPTRVYINEFHTHP
jgi:hypothetical protein|tara:strand:- start:44 stop:292 length:249 start_codon:yes stop_codon:yes gene_type:complete